MLINKLIFVTVTIAFMFNNAFSWGYEGHQIVANIAEKYLSKNTIAELKNIQQDGSLIDSLFTHDVYAIQHNSCK